MSRPARVVDVKPLGGFRVQLTFSDGLVRELDLEGLLEGKVFDSLKDPGEFSRVSLDEVAGTIVWPNGVDLDPDVLHGDHPPASGPAAVVLKEYRLRPTA
ncbi:MAG: DUF2442 domain-containing protein [Actinomycetota bacterium]|nr:DUF2442 domain-containing protein [Actinomycetota bacterium]